MLESIYFVLEIVLRCLSLFFRRGWIARVLGNPLAFPKGESDVWHETRRALAEHEEAGWARWNRGRIKRANYGFAADHEEDEKKRGGRGEKKREVWTAKIKKVEDKTSPSKFHGHTRTWGPGEFIASPGPRCNYPHSEILERVSPRTLEQRNVREIADKFS